ELWRHGPWLGRHIAPGKAAQPQGGTDDRRRVEHPPRALERLEPGRIAQRLIGPPLPEAVAEDGPGTGGPTIVPHGQIVERLHPPAAHLRFDDSAGVFPAVAKRCVPTDLLVTGTTYALHGMRHHRPHVLPARHEPAPVVLVDPAASNAEARIVAKPFDQ